MIPENRAELSSLVSRHTLETYEELSYQLVMMIDQVKKNAELTDFEKNDEIMLDIMGYIKSCTNEIIVNVLADIYNLK